MNKCDQNTRSRTRLNADGSNAWKWDFRSLAPRGEGLQTAERSSRNSLVTTWRASLNEHSFTSFHQSTEIHIVFLTVDQMLVLLVSNGAESHAENTEDTVIERILTSLTTFCHYALLPNTMVSKLCDYFSGILFNKWKLASSSCPILYMMSRQ